jgi:hypothetical protein
MTQDEILDALKKETNMDEANRMYELWKEDPTRNLETLKKLAGVGFGNKVEAYTGKGRRPVTEAFGISEDQYRLLIDPNSPINWMTIPSKELLKAAIAGGYVRDIPKNASEDEKVQQRGEYNDFLRMLSDESNLQGHRNAIREYEKTKFTEDPLGWAQVGLNNTLFRTYQKRAKEQALKGEGATSWGTMDAGDAGALTGDIGVNTMLGAGAGGISKALLGRGVGRFATAPYNNYGLRTFGNVAGSDLSAGVLAGLGAVANRDMNTEDGARGYEYITEPALTGAINTIATPAVLREGVGNVANLIGVGGAKLDNLGKKSFMQKAQRYANEKYAEPALASALKDMEANTARTIENSPVTAETQAQVNKMFDILNDGVSNSPGKATSLFDDLQTLYENSARKEVGVRGERASWSNSVAPNEGRFRVALDGKIADLEGAIANSAGKEEAPALQRELSYYRNFRDLMDNGLVDADSYLMQTEGKYLEAPHSNYVLDEGNTNTLFFELGKRASKSDMAFMKDFVNNVRSGRNISLDNGIATRIRELGKKYPEFERFIDSQMLIPSENKSSLWMSLGKSATDKTGRTYNEPLVHVTGGDAKRAYGGRQYDQSVSEAIRYPLHTSRMVLGDALRAPGVFTRNVAGDVIKPGIVEARLMKYDKPDNSYETLEAQFNELRKRKPEAVDAAMSWKFDPKLPSDRQLTMEDRDLIDRFREAQRRKVLGDD